MDFDQFDANKILGDKSMQNLPRAEVADAAKKKDGSSGLGGASHAANGKSKKQPVEASSLEKRKSAMFPDEEEEEKKAGEMADNGDQSDGDFNILKGNNDSGSQDEAFLFVA